MTMHLFGTILTPQAVAHNNRGESEGTVSTLQKVIRNGDLYSTISSEAIRYGIREGWLADDAVTLNRKVSHNESVWVDKEFKNPAEFVDNDVLGYMHAKKETVSRRGILEISRAVSTTPWPGTVSAHFASPGSNPAVAADNPIPYQCEVHDTRYQYTFALTPDALLTDNKTRTEKTLLAIQNLRRPAGNHARFLFDFAPEAVILRWTSDPAPRMMFCFEQGEDGRLSLQKLVARVKGGDILAKELAIGTAESIDGLEELKKLDVPVYDGVKKAFADILARVGRQIKD
ncbi:MAG TPA: type I-B CRISPR-associated protein Cas7/Cst2/DevR [Gemmataceae bacterium]|jgi:CRISPR-associated protein Cst2